MTTYKSCEMWTLMPALRLTGRIKGNKCEAGTRTADTLYAPSLRSCLAGHVQASEWDEFETRITKTHLLTLGFSLNENEVKGSIYVKVPTLCWTHTIYSLSLSGLCQGGWQGDHNSFESVVYLLANSKVKQINQSLGESEQNESHRIESNFPFGIAFTVRSRTWPVDICQV